MYAPEEAVSRFFPAGANYDRNQAKRLIRWLDSCGYALVLKDKTTVSENNSLPAPKPLPECLRTNAFGSGFRKSAK